MSVLTVKNKPAGSLGVEAVRQAVDDFNDRYPAKHAEIIHRGFYESKVQVASDEDAVLFKLTT